jgi:hypothetical protein
MMLCVIIAKMFMSWAPLNVELFLRTLSFGQWYRISIAFDCFCLIVSLMMLNAVELSVRRGVRGCVCPSPVSVTLCGAPLWAL